MIAETGQTKRNGTVSVTTLLAVPGLLVLAGLVIYVGTLRDARTETQTGADAAALASARALACDDLLTDDLTRAKNRIARARTAALTLGHANFAQGERLSLALNPNNDPDGDLVFGTLDRPVGGNFQACGQEISDFIGDRVNAVRAKVRRSAAGAPFGGCAPDRDILACSTAMLDWCVVGFRPNNDKCIPLIPIGIFTDHSGSLPNAWDSHCRRRERDEWRLDESSGKFVRGSDGIPEVTVLIGGSGEEKDVTGAFLRVGVHSLAETVSQLRSGMNRDQLRAQFGASGFVLDGDNALPVPCSRECPAEGEPARHALEAALRELCATGEGRIWPLFSAVNEMHGIARVSGWTAARVVACESVVGGGLKLRLQPTVVCHPSTVTEHRSSPPAFCATNRTVCRVRLAE